MNVPENVVHGPDSLHDCLEKIFAAGSAPKTGDVQTTQCRAVRDQDVRVCRDVLPFAYNRKISSYLAQIDLSISLRNQ